jgi:hypothetical protein
MARQVGRTYNASVSSRPSSSSPNRWTVTRTQALESAGVFRARIDNIRGENELWSLETLTGRAVQLTLLVHPFAGRLAHREL